MEYDVKEYNTTKQEKFMINKQYVNLQNHE